MHWWHIYYVEEVLFNFNVVTKSTNLTLFNKGHHLGRSPLVDEPLL